MTSYLLLFPILWPMAGGVWALLAGRNDERRRDLAAGGVNLIELAASLGCYHLQGASFHPLGFRPI